MASARRCPPRGRGGCAPDAVFLPPDFATYRAASKQVHGHPARARRARRGRGARRGVPRRRPACTRRARRCAGCSRRSRPRPSSRARSASDPTSSSPRSHPTPRSPPASSCSRASRRARASPPRRPGSCPASGPKTAARLVELGLKHARGPWAPRPEQLLVDRFGANLGRELRRRARFEHDGVIGAAPPGDLGVARADLRPRHPSTPNRLREELIRMAGPAVREPRRPRPPRTRSGVQEVHLEDFTTVTRAAHDRRTPTMRRRSR